MLTAECDNLQLEVAMQHVFGRTFICDSEGVARDVTFNKDVDRRDRHVICMWSWRTESVNLV